MKTYSLDILTPRGRSFAGEVIHALVPAEDGFVGVLANHTAYVTSSPGGRLEVRLPSGEVQPVRVGPGFFQFDKNHAFFMTQSADTGLLHPPT